MGLSAQAADSNSNQVVAAFDTPIFNTLVYVREGLFGSNISRVDGVTLPIAAAGGAQRFTFTAEADSKVSFTVTPRVAADLTVSVVNSTNALVLGPFVGSAGASIAIAPWTVPVSGTFKLVVTSNVPTGLHLESARNAALESQVGDSTYVSEMDISPSQRVYNTGNTNEVVGTSAAGLSQTKSNYAAKFVDISASGTPIVLTDDGEAEVTTTVGNAFFPAGAVTIGSNGGIWASALSNLDYINTTIASIPVDSPPGLFPFWDDLDAGTVYWQELVINGINTFVVQWNSRPHYSTIGATTFQVQVPATGTVLARYAYKDVLFENAAYDNGSSATVGIVTADGRLQYSFNTPSLANNDYIEFTRQDDIDEFTFSGVAGQKVGVAFDALKLGAADLNGTFVRLLNSSNAVLAQASTKPLSVTSTVSNYDLGLVNFVLPTTGTFSVRVYGKASFDYYLAITKNLALDTENTTGSSTPRYLVTLPGAVLGHLTTSDVRDLYAFQLNAGQAVRLTLTRPDDDVGISPVNNLQPRLVVTRPTGSAGTSGSTFNSLGQIVVNYTAVESGQHLIDVRRVTGFGVYAIKAELITPGLRGEGETAAALAALATSADSDTARLVTTNSAATPAIVSSSIVTPAIERPLPSVRASGWQDTAQPTDVNGDGRVTALDALLLINELNSRIGISGSQLPPRASASQVDQFFDTNGDGVISPLDALLVVERLNRK